MKYIRTVGVWGFVYMLCFSYHSLAQDNHPFVLDVPYVPTPEIVVDKMLQLAEVSAGDILYDLGSGDGRIPITAAKRFGIKAVGRSEERRVGNERRIWNGTLDVKTTYAV